MISLASNLAQKDEQLVFNLALRSLKGKKPSIDSNATRFFTRLKVNNPALSEMYFEKLLKAIKKSDDRNILVEVLDRSLLSSSEDSSSFQISESQSKELLEILLPRIKKESQELLEKKRTNCGLINTGRRLLGNFQTLLPSKTSIVQEAINVCNKSEIDPWKKPGFLKGRYLKTSEDYLELSKTIGNKETQASWVYAAALKARDEKNYKLSISILDGIDTNSKVRLRQGWDWTRIEVSKNLIREFIGNKSFAEVDAVIDEAPPQLRPYIILEVLGPLGGFAYTYPDLRHRLLDRAKAEFARMDFPLPAPVRSYWLPVNPAKFLNLVDGYYQAGDKNEAIGILRECVRLQNQLSTTYATKDANGRIVSYYHFSLNKRFIEDNYESVCQSIGQIEATPIRLEFRLNVLWQTTRNGAIGGSGTIVIQ